MMRRLADCCCFSPSFYWHFFPPFTPEVAAFSPQGSLWTGPDVPGSTLPHSPPHGIFMGNQAPQHSAAQHSTAQHRAAQTRDHLFINFITLLPGCLMHNNISTYKRIFSPFCSSLSHPPHPLSFYSVSFHWHGSPGCINMLFGLLLLPTFLFTYS